MVMNALMEWPGYSLAATPQCWARLRPVASWAGYRPWLEGSLHSQQDPDKVRFTWGFASHVRWALVGGPLLVAMVPSGHGPCS